MKKSVRFLSLCLALGMLVVASAAIAQEPEPEVCQISRTVECDAVELCGPEGPYEYVWNGPGVTDVTTRCITATQDGTYFLETFNLDTDTKGECEASVTLEGCEEPPPCEIENKGENPICDGESAELCGPEGDYSYLWNGPGIDDVTTRCITAEQAGTYYLEVTDNGSELKSDCEYTLRVEECQNNCPRTPGYWRQQAEQKGNGSTKFSLSDIIAIAECIDARLDYIDWPGGNASRLAMLDALTPGGPGWDQEGQAQRHLVALVANLCADGYTPTHGGDVYLSGSTSITCDGASTTIDGLVDDLDDALVEGSGYHVLGGCADAVNNGRGIGELCDGKKEEAKKDLLGRGGAGASDLSGNIQLYRPFPNPTTGSMRMAFAVEGSGQKVDIGVYDIAGRLVQQLSSGFKSGGIHQVEWNGRDMRGGKVGVGVYFVRGLVGDRQVNSRIVMTQ